MPGLMGAGILLSIAMLLSDGFKKLFPVRGERARAARLRVGALGRASDLLAVGSGRPPRPARVRYVPRSRPGSLLLGVLAASTTLAVALATLSVYNAKTGLLSNRGWTLGAGYALGGVFGFAALVWLASAALGERRPRWLQVLASWPPLGGLPHPEEAVDPLTRPVALDLGPGSPPHDSLHPQHPQHAQEVAIR